VKKKLAQGNYTTGPTVWSHKSDMQIIAPPPHALSDAAAEDFIDAGHSIEGKITPATRSLEICFLALHDLVTLTFNLLI